MIRKFQVVSLSCLASLATAAGAAQAAPMGPATPVAKAHAAGDHAPSVPAPQNGMIEGVSLSTLNTIAACESGGNPSAVNAAGYYGKYQFDMGTWASVGGHGNPADAPEAEQDYRAALLYSRASSSPWPVCGV